MEDRISGRLIHGAVIDDGDDDDDDDAFFLSGSEWKFWEENLTGDFVFEWALIPLASARIL